MSVVIKGSLKFRSIEKSAEIRSEIYKEKQIGNIKYATADYGSDIKKGLRLSGIAHIHDFSHLVALILEKMYSI